MICANPKCGKEFERLSQPKKYCCRKCKGYAHSCRWRKENPEKVKASSLKWANRNQETFRARLRALAVSPIYNTNEKKRERHQRYREKNVEKRYHQSLNWKSKNKDRASEHQRKAHKKYIDTVADPYVINLLQQRFRAFGFAVTITPEMVETKRVSIRIKRKLSKLKQIIHEKSTNVPSGSRASN